MAAETSPSQENLIGFLQQAENYPHSPEKVNIVQTHASVLAMATPYVYKFKKPFDFGFMDFRSLESRKKNCEKELQLNRRLCQDIYLDVLPVYQDNAKLSFNSGGRIVDYALRMKQLPDGFFLHQLLQKGMLKASLLDKVLKVLIPFYQKQFEGQPADPAIGQYADLEALGSITRDNFDSLRKVEKGLLPLQELKLIEEATQNFLQRQQALIQKRVAEGHIMDCHGDLHLDHIHIKDDRVCIYDCIEFSDRYRYIDVAADIAFLAMDLDYAGRPDLSFYLVQQTAAALQDDEMLLLMDFYKSYRACVRAKVESIQAKQSGNSGNSDNSDNAEAEQQQKEGQQQAQQAQFRERMQKHISLALRYSVIGSRPVLILVCGRIGSGKSTLARHIASKLQLPHYASDRIRKESAGLAPEQASDPETKKWLYSTKKSREVYDILLEKSLEQLKKQQSVVIDASFSKRAYRDNFSQALKALGFSYYFVEATAAESIIKERLKERENKPVVSDARLEDFEALNKSFEELKEIPPSHYIPIHTESSKAESLQSLLKALQAKSQSPDY